MTLYDMYSVNKKYTESDTLYLYNLHIICISMWFFYMIIQKIHIWHIWHIWDIYSNIYIYTYLYNIYIYTSFIQASSPTHQANQNPPKTFCRILSWMSFKLSAQIIWSFGLARCVGLVGGHPLTGGCRVRCSKFAGIWLRWMKSGELCSW